MLLTGLAIAGGLTALGSTIYGAVKSSSENRKAQELIARQKRENEDWYNARMSEDFTSRPDAQRVIQKQRELLEERYKKARAAQVVGGASDESVQREQESANAAMADTMSAIAAQGADYKERVENSYRNQDAGLTQQQVAVHEKQAQQTAQAASQAAQAGLNLVGAAATAETSQTGYTPALKELEGSKAIREAAHNDIVNQAQADLDATIRNQTLSALQKKV